MALRSLRVQALVAVLSFSMCGCAMVGLGYRAGHKRTSGKSEAARLTQLAELYERQGHPSGAMRLYRQAIHADPRSTQARERLMALSSHHASPPQAPDSRTPGLAPETAPMLAGSGAVPRTVAAVPAQPAPAAAQPVQTVQRSAQAIPSPTPQVAARPATPVFSVAQSAAVAAAAAAAATPLPHASAHPTASIPVVEATPAPLTAPAAAAAIQPSVVQRAPLPPVEPEEGLDAPASLAIDVQPLPTLPEPVAVIEPVPLPPTTDWSSSRSQTVSQVPAALPEAVETGIEIRPQLVNESPAIVRIPNAEWAPTDLKRLCPSASNSLLSIVRRLESADAADRKDALTELAEMGESARPVVAAVRSVMHDPVHAVRAHAAWAVCRIEGVNAECVQVLADVLGTDDASGAAFAAYCLGLLEQDAHGAVAALELACNSESGTVRLCAAEALLKITPESAEPVGLLIDGLHQPDEAQRWLAALSLSSTSAPYQESAILALTPMLSDESPDVCSAAALALGAYGPTSQPAVPALQTALTHSDPDVCEAAAAALNCIVE